MGIGGKINRPRTELKKKLFKRRRVLAKGARQHKRRALSRDTPPLLWGKRRRKLMKRLRAAALRQGPEAEVGGGGKRLESGSPGDVEMGE